MSAPARTFFRSEIHALDRYKTPAGQGNPRIYAGSNENVAFKHGLEARMVFLRAFFNPQKLNRYADPMATRACKAIARYVNADTPEAGITGDNVACFGGGEQGIQTLVNALGTRGDKVATTSWRFDMTRVFTDMQGVLRVQAPLKDGVFFTKETADAVIDALKNNDGVKGAFVEAVNNPLGTTAARELLEKILREAPKDKLVIIDEAYYEFSGKTVADLLKQHENLVILRSMSKAFGLAGMRIGYLLGSEEVIERLKAAKPTFNVTRLTQELVEACLTPRGVRMARKARELVRSERNAMVAELEEEGIEILPSEGNFFTLKTPGKAKELFEKLKADYGIVLRACSNDLLRITICTPRENKEILKAVKEVLLGRKEKKWRQKLRERAEEERVMWSVERVQSLNADESLDDKRVFKLTCEWRDAGKLEAKIKAIARIVASRARNEYERKNCAEFLEIAARANADVSVAAEELARLFNRKTEHGGVADALKEAGLRREIIMAFKESVKRYGRGARDRILLAIPKIGEKLVEAPREEEWETHTGGW